MQLQMQTSRATFPRQRTLTTGGETAGLNQSHKTLTRMQTRMQTRTLTRTSLGLFKAQKTILSQPRSPKKLSRTGMPLTEE